MKFRLFHLTLLTLLQVTVSHEEACSLPTITDTCLPCGGSPLHHRPNFASIISTIERLKSRVHTKLNRLALMYDISPLDNYAHRPNIDDCCGYESITDLLNMEMPTDLNSLHRALTEVASLFNDVISLNLTDFDAMSDIVPINITLCQLRRYFTHAAFLRHPTAWSANFANCRRSSSLTQCNCSQNCKVKIVIDYLYSAGTLLAKISLGAQRAKNNHCRSFRGLNK